MQYLLECGWEGYFIPGLTLPQVRVSQEANPLAEEARQSRPLLDTHVGRRYPVH